MALYLLSKDKRARAMFSNAESTRLRLAFFFRIYTLSEEQKQKINLLFLRKLRHFLPYSVRSRNRCVRSGRAGSIFRYFRLSRICLKGLASNGFLTGVRKSSW